MSECRKSFERSCSLNFEFFDVLLIPLSCDLEHQDLALFLVFIVVVINVKSVVVYGTQGKRQVNLVLLVCILHLFFKLLIWIISLCVRILVMFFDIAAYPTSSMTLSACMIFSPVMAMNKVEERTLPWGTRLRSLNVSLRWFSTLTLALLLFRKLHRSLTVMSESPTCKILYFNPGCHSVKCFGNFSYY